MKENNLPSTAFLAHEDDKFNIPWISPEYELAIYEHRTLSAGHVILIYLESSWEKVDLQS